MPEPDSVQRILTEAERLFAERGYAGASLNGIARAAGLGNAGLLHHFGSKAALYRAVLDGIGADFDRRNARVLELSEDPVEQLRGLIGVMVDIHRERPTAVMIIAQEFLDASTRIAEAGTLPLAGVIRDTMSVVEAGQALGRVRRGDPLAVVATIHGALIYGVLGTVVLGRIVDGGIDEGWEQSVADLVAGALIS